MRVIQLNGIAIRKFFVIIAILFCKVPEDCLKGCAGEEILLFQAQALSLLGAVIRVQDGRNAFRQSLFLHGCRIFLLVEKLKTEWVNRFRLPEAERVDCLSPITNHRHIIRDSIDVLVAQNDKYFFIFPAHAPRITPGKPVIRFFVLKAVAEALLKKAVAVTDSKAHKRDILCCSAVEEAGGKTSKAAVSKGIIFNILKKVCLPSNIFQKSLCLLQEAKVHQIAVNNAAKQEFCRKITSDLPFFRLLPCLAAYIHRGVRNSVVKLFRISGRRLNMFVLQKPVPDCFLK